VRAVVLAGGLGRRLYPYTACLPKPLVPVGDRPILEINLLRLKQAGVNHVTLATGHLAQLIMAFFGSGEKYGLRIDYTIEEQPLGTMGPLRLVEDLDDTFLVMNGDLLTDLSFEGLLAHHRERQALLTLGTFRKRVKLALGVVETRADGCVTGFQEKPELSFDVSAGIYALEPRILDYLPEGGPMGFDKLMEVLLRDEQPISTYLHEGVWYDIGSPDDYERAIDHYETSPHQFLPV
jgi:NDP-mannose synthase